MLLSGSGLRLLSGSGLRLLSGSKLRLVKARKPGENASPYTVLGFEHGGCVDVFVFSPKDIEQAVQEEDLIRGCLDHGSAIRARLGATPDVVWVRRIEVAIHVFERRGADEPASKTDEVKYVSAGSHTITSLVVVKDVLKE